MIAERLARY